MTKNAIQTEKAIFSVTGVLLHKRQLQLLGRFCTLIKEQKDKAIRDARQKDLKMSEALAVPYCAVDGRCWMNRRGSCNRRLQNALVKKSARTILLSTNPEQGRTQS